MDGEKKNASWSLNLFYKKEWLTLDAFCYLLLEQLIPEVKIKNFKFLVILFIDGHRSNIKLRISVRLTTCKKNKLWWFVLLQMLHKFCSHGMLLLCLSHSKRLWKHLNEWVNDTTSSKGTKKWLAYYTMYGRICHWNMIKMVFELVGNISLGSCSCEITIKNGWKFTNSWMRPNVIYVLNMDLREIRFMVVGH